MADERKTRNAFLENLKGISKIFYNADQIGDEGKEAFEHTPSLSTTQTPFIQAGSGEARSDDATSLAEALSRATKRGLDEFLSLFTTIRDEIGDEEKARNLAIKQTSMVFKITPNQLLEAVHERLAILDSELSAFSQGIEEDARDCVREGNQKIEDATNRLKKIREQISALEVEESNLSKEEDATRQEIEGVKQRREKRQADFMVTFNEIRDRFVKIGEQLKKTSN